MNIETIYEGKIGVNNVSPQYPLDVSGSVNITGNLSVDTNTFFVDASNNRVGVGTINTNPSSKLTVNSNDSTAAISINRYNKDGPAYLYFGATDGSEGIPTSVTGGRTIGNINFAAYDGTKFIGSVATIAANVDTGSVGSTNMPGNLRFYTRTPNDVSDTNAALQTFERMRITSSGNVGIGTTIPSSTLDVSGVINAKLFKTGGTASNNAGFTNSVYLESNVPSLTLSNTGTGLGKYTLGATTGNFGIWNNTTSNYPLYINSSSSVGIGTSNPQDRLDVRGVTRITNDNGASMFHVYWPNSTGNSPTIIDALINSGMDYGELQTRGSIQTFYTTTTERMRIESTGNVGINTTTPSATLDVNGTGKISGNFTVDTNTFFVDASNNRVGIGTSTPVFPLDVVNQNSGIIAEFTSYFSDSLGPLLTRKARGTFASPLPVLAGDRIGGIVGAGWRGDSWYNGGAYQILTEADFSTASMPTALSFQTTSSVETSRSEKMRITGDGKVGINTTTPGEKLSIEGSGTANENVLRVNNQGNFASRIWLRNSQRSSYFSMGGTAAADTLATGTLAGSLSMGVAAANAVQFFNGSSPSVKMTILGNGNTGIGTNAPTTTLDVNGTANITGFTTFGTGGLLRGYRQSTSASGTLDIDTGSAGGGFQGLLIISNTRNSNGLTATYATYSVFGRGTAGQFTQIATRNGTTAGCPFSLTIPSSDVLRVTNNDTETATISAQFIGGNTI